MLKVAIKKIYNSIMYIPRERYRKKMRKKLSNSNFSIIASDCFGTFMYHTLGEKFNSPTINLFFRQDDFFLFVSYLKEYLSVELIHLKDSSVNYPVGQLTYNNRSIRIDFMHYKSFEEAKQKWEERKRRVDFSNLYIVQVVPKGLTQEYVNSFSSLPYKHKLLVTHENNFISECMVQHKIFTKKNYRSGEILNYKSYISCKRHMDDIDYISFLNNK